MKIQFLLNILLSVVWVFLTGTVNATNFTFGFILSFLVLWLISSNHGKEKYFAIIPYLISFIFYFLYELVKANIQVAADVVTPKFYMQPGIIKYPLEAKTDLEITLLANVITLTPGTLSLDVSKDRKVLYIHAMYVHDKQEFIDSIKNGF